MIPIPKPKFFERKVPTGQSEDDYFDEIIARQTTCPYCPIFSNFIADNLPLKQA